MGYALGAACLAAIIGIQFSGICQDAVSLGLGRWLTQHPIDQQLRGFLSQCSALL
jgi:hypothetical protein